MPEQQTDAQIRADAREQLAALQVLGKQGHGIVESVRWCLENGINNDMQESTARACFDEQAAKTGMPVDCPAINQVRSRFEHSLAAALAGQPHELE